MGQFFDTTEITPRWMRMVTLFHICEAQVEAGSVPEWLRDHFCEEHLNEITEAVALPAEIGRELLTIAVFLDRALAAPPSRVKAPKDVKREVAALRQAHSALITGLSGLSAEAQYALARVDEACNEIGESTFVLSEPPVEKALALLQKLGVWIAEADLPPGRRGAKRSPKFFAARLLRQLLHTRKGEATTHDLTYLAEAIIEPVAEKHGHESRLRDLVEKVLAEPEVTCA